MWDEITIPKLQWLHCWNLGIDKQVDPTLYWICDYLSMLWLKLIHVSKRGPWYGMIIMSSSYDVCFTFAFAEMQAIWYICYNWLSYNETLLCLPQVGCKPASVRNCSLHPSGWLLLIDTPHHTEPVWPHTCKPGFHIHPCLMAYSHPGNWIWAQISSKLGTIVFLKM